MEKKQTNHRLTHALRFALLGIRVLPLTPNSKSPLIRDWPRGASASEPQIREWFHQWPDCNYGLLMGEGYCVLDIDVKPGRGVNGFSSLKELVPESLDNTTLRVRTPSGGAHYYFQLPKPLDSKISLRSGIDFLSIGRYVVGPGSAIDGNSYEIAGPLAEIVKAPAWLEKAIAPSHGVEAPVERFIASGAGFDYSDYLSCSDSSCSGAKSELATLSRLLAATNPDLPYEAWFEAIFGSLNAFGCSTDVVKQVQDWSKAGAKYDENEFWKKIESYDPKHPRPVGLTRLRQLASKYPATSNWLPDCKEANDLEDRIFKRAVAILLKNGNAPSVEHKEGLRLVCKGLAHGVYEPEKKFRIAFPLQTGMGKTTSVIALVSELKNTDKSLLIAAERIEQLQELHDELVKKGGCSRRSCGDLP